jgi:ABC-type nickel/cobalt efflux system permease component RcnA
MRALPTRLFRAAVLAMVSLAPAAGHPMGNFSVSHYARFDVRPTGVQLTYALDLAELPTFELLQGWNLDGRDRPAIATAARAEAKRWLSGLRISMEGKHVRPVLEKAHADVTDGAGGLPVLRVTIAAALPVPPGAIEYEDRNYPFRAGWKEIVIAAHGGARLEAPSHAAQDRSQTLTAYPADATAAPPQETTASFRWRIPAPTVVSRATPPPPPAETQPPVAAPSFSEQQQASARGVVTRGDYLSRMLGGGEITFSMLLVGLCAAFGLGAMHALSPGHGKALVAAYLVGSRGAIKHALFLGATVTVTHTISVFALGFAILFFQQYVVPERIIPLLGAVSGASIVVIAARLLIQRARGLTHGHEHSHHHHNHSHPHSHSHGGHTHTHLPQGDMSVSSLLALGVTGGLTPCPSALVLLLSAVALGRTALGLLLLTGFSAGLALVLTAVGVMVLYARNLLPQRAGQFAPVFRYIPVVSAAVVMLLGLVMTGVSLGWIQPSRFIG